MGSHTAKAIGLIALGANISSDFGPPEATIRAALDRVDGTEIQILNASPLFTSPAFPKGLGPDYVNAAATIVTRLAPDDLLSRLHDVEAEFGRKRFVRWGDRTLDLDLIAYDGQVLPDRATFDAWRGLAPAQQAARAPDRPIVPHPRMQERAFVLVPLARIAPDWRHPVLGLTVTEMLAALPPMEVGEITEV